MSTSTLVVVRNGLFFRSFLKYSCFTTHSNPTSFSPLLQLLSLPTAPAPAFNQRRYFHISSLSTKTTETTSTRKPLAIYLMQRLGFSEEDSLSISKRLVRQRDYPNVKQVTDLISYENADNVITFLQDENECGLDLSQIKKLITKHPKVLASEVDKTIKPKIKLLQDLGFSTSDLALALCSNPRLYLACDLSPAIQALKGIMGSDEGVVRVFKGFKWEIATQITKNLIPNVTMLENEYGITKDKLVKFMTMTPHSLLRNTESLRDLLVKMEGEWGITRDSTEFLRAVHAFNGLTDEKMNSKCQVFRSYGWSDSDILSLIRRLPTCLGLSEGGMKKKLDFYMKELGYDPAYMASRPALFSYSLENRVVPRYTVLSILKEKGFIKATNQLYNDLMMSEDRFFDTSILPYEKILPNLRNVYINRRAPSEVPQLKEA